MTGALRQVSPPGPTLRFQFDPEELRPAGGVGGWSRQDRPHLVQAVEQGSTPAFELPVPLRFDGQDRSTPVEGPYRQLLQWGYNTRVGRPAPVLQLLLGPFVSLRWVLNDLVVNDEGRRPDGLLIYLDCVATLLEHSSLGPKPGPADSVRASLLGVDPATGRAYHSDGTRHYTLRPGDTLQRIALRLFGDRHRWSDIRKLNPLLRDPHHPGRPGTTIRVPAR